MFIVPSTIIILIYQLFRLSPKRYNTLSRADRKYQGWAEIAAFYLDRVMGFNKKPPITGRIMTNKELFEFDDTWKNMVNIICNFLYRFIFL